jgi:glycosyltransferase involved in cell wall biosynthesis
MPDIHLVVLYGIHDSQKDEYIALAGGAANIHFHILVDNENLPKIISGAICSIAVSREEDFGMVATESMCCGVPVVCIAEGGYRETVVHTQTGYMI